MCHEESCEKRRAYCRAVEDDFDQTPEDRANRLERVAETLAEKAVDLEDRARAAEAERDAYRKAKQENDERFQLEAAAQRERAERAEAERDEARDALRRIEATLVDGEGSDGHHTHNELYEYRMLYNAHAALGWHAAGIPVVKSWHHSDGEECFGGGWFIVTATLSTGQVSNHYKAEHWRLFDVPEVEFPPAYDGHSPADGAARMRDALSHPNRWCPKVLREHLCQQQLVAPDDFTRALIGALIKDLDGHRPLGPDGKHGDLHTATCGCDDR